MPTLQELKIESDSLRREDKFEEALPFAVVGLLDQQQ